MSWGGGGAAAAAWIAAHFPTLPTALLLTRVEQPATAGEEAHSQLIRSHNRLLHCKHNSVGSTRTTTFTMPSLRSSLMRVHRTPWTLYGHAVHTCTCTLVENSASKYWFIRDKMTANLNFPTWFLGGEFIRKILHDSGSGWLSPVDGGYIKLSRVKEWKLEQTSHYIFIIF